MLRTGSEQIHASFKTNQTYGEDINNALRVHNVDVSVVIKIIFILTI